MTKPDYIVCAPPFNINSGGTIVLHKLCHTLNTLGERAFVWPMPLRHSSLWANIRYNLSKGDYLLCDDLDTPVADRTLFSKNAIVVYPEVVFGNPTKAENVVRWLLNRPGSLGREFRYGTGELFFKFDNNCDVASVTGGGVDELFLLSFNDAYRDNQSAGRKGSCYIVRKGVGEKIVHDLSDSVKIDGLSHAEVADIFSRKKYFYSYDEGTLYSQYAAVCGCISIVVPTSYPSREAYIESHPLARYGIAYGLDDIDHAIATKHLTFGHLKRLEQDGVQSVRRFVETTYRHFGFG